MESGGCTRQESVAIHACSTIYRPLLEARLLSSTDFLTRLQLLLIDLSNGGSMSGNSFLAEEDLVPAQPLSMSTSLNFLLITTERCLRLEVG
ncbi:hypothetical protein RRG08_048584 [Elysia crispata]|uniref:Uncharacterized protein n=1 Tax=Elysia crispata TaxID=231223 RepID=A0AAE1EA09_9GAST|nr:hypothetical protein RRG08_048584 [Elysia crispata]